MYWGLFLQTPFNPDDEMTPLDKALQAAIKDQTKAGEFYNLFLRSTIYIPTFDVPEREGVQRADGKESFNPVIIETGDEKTLILFDTLQRLEEYATREIGYVAVPGHVILEAMPGDLYWALNHTTDYYKEFTPEEIEYLKTQVEDSRTEPATVREHTTILIGAPATIPERLVEDLCEALERNDEVTSAHLGQVYIVADGEVPHMALAVRTGGISDRVKQAMIRDLSMVCRGKLGEGEHIDILVDEMGEISEGIINQVDPFYTRT